MCRSEKKVHFTSGQADPELVDGSLNCSNCFSSFVSWCSTPLSFFISFFCSSLSSTFRTIFSSSREFALVKGGTGRYIPTSKNTVPEKVQVTADVLSASPILKHSASLNLSPRRGKRVSQFENSLLRCLSFLTPLASYHSFSNCPLLFCCVSFSFFPNTPQKHHYRLNILISCLFKTSFCFDANSSMCTVTKLVRRRKTKTRQTAHSVLFTLGGNELQVAIPENTIEILGT